jgi:hypothetical protein
MVLHPRHRADCYDLFTAPHETESVQFQGPALAVCEFEHAAARAGRTWNSQLTYVLGLCLGKHPPDFDDGRTVEDWRTLLAKCAFRLSEAENWTSFTYLQVKQQGR